jgi:toxin FitB
MGESVKRYLIDTNILILYLNGEADSRARERIEIIFTHSFAISVISKMEFLGFRGYSEDDYVLANNFIRNARIISITSEIVETTIDLRRKGSIKLPDAIIAATALCENSILITHNPSDFNRIDGLMIEDPCVT